MKEIWLIRHGETEWNAQKRFQGHLDVPLSPVGIGQAFRLAQRLARSQLPFDGLFSSDLRRARETAEPLVSVLGLPLRTTPLLREIDVGHLAGLDREEAEARYPGFVQEALRDPWHTPRPGGESMADLARRLAAFLEELPPGRHLLVTHGGIVRAALKMALELEGTTWRRFRIPNTSITRLLLPEQEVLGVADTAHLETWADWLSDESLK
ncbi:histidine phosphatase family protein [Thermus thermamylovorans]|uniref:Histidine phosphatase family protein n=1 Tax=Thermus thermamylovorans TaxID=2509362 RepID=A0A4Q9AW28_9DEIN|nr:histidine phosphatase family protein [Thermus thermamylovorans]TBH15480.1 histidine phosphatase family protein [Thermus thermamylovorans]